MHPASTSAAAAPHNAVSTAGYPAAGAPAAGGAPRPPPIRVKLQVPLAARSGPLAQPGQQQAPAAVPPTTVAPQLRPAAPVAHQQVRSPAAVLPCGAAITASAPTSEIWQTSLPAASAPSVAGAMAAVSPPPAGGSQPAAGSSQTLKQPAALHPDAILAWAQQLRVSGQQAVPPTSCGAAGTPAAASGATLSVPATTASPQQPAAPAAVAAAQPQQPTLPRPPRQPRPLPQSQPLQHQPNAAAPGSWIPLHPLPASPSPLPQRPSLDPP